MPIAAAMTCGAAIEGKAINALEDPSLLVEARLRKRTRGHAAGLDDEEIVARSTRTVDAKDRSCNGAARRQRAEVPPATPKGAAQLWGSTRVASRWKNAATATTSTKAPSAINGHLGPRAREHRGANRHACEKRRQRAP